MMALFSLLVISGHHIIILISWNLFIVIFLIPFHQSGSQSDKIITTSSRRVSKY